MTLNFKMSICAHQDISMLKTSRKTSGPVFFFFIPNYLGFNLIFVNWNSLRKKVNFAVFKIATYKRLNPILLLHFNSTYSKTVAYLSQYFKNFVAVLI